MTAGASAQSTVIREIAYDPADPLDVLQDSIKWAETRLEELKKTYQLVYPWRAGGAPDPPAV